MVLKCVHRELKCVIHQHKSQKNSGKWSWSIYTKVFALCWYKVKYQLMLDIGTTRLNVFAKLLNRKTMYNYQTNIGEK